MIRPVVKSLQTREEMRAGEHKKKKHSKGGSLLLMLIVMAVMIFGAVNLRVHYTQENENLNRVITRTKRELHEIEREIANLKQNREKLSSYAYIMKKNEEFRLGLRPADPRQIRKVAIVRRGDEGPRSIQRKKQVRSASVKRLK